MTGMGGKRKGRDRWRRNGFAGVFDDVTGNDVYVLALVVGCRQGSPERSTEFGTGKGRFRFWRHRNNYVWWGEMMTDLVPYKFER